LESLSEIELLRTFSSSPHAESAQAFKTACEKVKDYSVELATPDGQNFDIFAGWVGYFERLDEIHVEQTKLKYRFQ
jgi:hypothetical protein